VLCCKDTVLPFPHHLGPYICCFEEVETRGPARLPGSKRNCEEGYIRRLRLQEWLFRCQPWRTPLRRFSCTKLDMLLTSNAPSPTEEYSQPLPASPSDPRCAVSSPRTACTQQDRHNHGYTSPKSPLAPRAARYGHCLHR
jgi:hypothetical protein